VWIKSDCEKARSDVSRDIFTYLLGPMDEVIQDICIILHDYHKYNRFDFNHEVVKGWIEQFDAKDRKFVLDEFLHLLKQGIYVDENKARELLLKKLRVLAAHYKFSRLRDFFANAEFVRLQPNDKSQSFLLDLLEGILQQEFHIGVANFGTESKKYVIYLDDILATGGTVFNDICKWMEMTDGAGEPNYKKIIRKEKVFIVSLFCIHTWGRANIEWKLKLRFGEDIMGKIFYCCDYVIENHPTFRGQKLNFAYPDKSQPQEVIRYLEGLSEIGERRRWKMTHLDVALRDVGKPAVESFYSSPQNRKRFEDILLMQGIEILGRVAKLKENHRPMGAIQPTYQTLGLGTLYFTWRNISNTTPIVFWWNNNGWHPLFELVNRGGLSAVDVFE
jgi:hypothetical protein